MRIMISILTILLWSCVNLSGQSPGIKEIIIIRTAPGDIYVRLDLKRAPVTTANFLRYIDAGLFDSTCFYRVVRTDNQPKDSILIEVIQGGMYENEENGLDPVIHETTRMTGIHHKNGTISMARSQPGSATSEFFICVGDQPELDYGGKRNPDGQGFAAFGRVIRGMKVVKKIHSINAPGQYLNEPVLINSISRKGK